MRSLLARLDAIREGNARLADPRHPLPEHVARDGVRTRLGAIELGDLAPGAWRPLAPRELEALRRGARLPPRAG